MRPAGLTVATIVTALALTGCGGNDAAGLPRVVLSALDGFEQGVVELDVGTLTGPAVVNVWATWCGPCRTELPDFQRASIDRPDVRFIGVDGGFDAGRSVAFLDELGVTYEQFVDPDGELSSGLEIIELPATIIVDSAGDVSFRHQGQVSYGRLIEELEAL